MSEDKLNQNQNDDSKNKEIEQLKREKAAIEMKLRRADEDLYSDEYLNFLQGQKEKQPPQDSFMSGGRLSDYSEDELKEVPINKLVGLIAGEVYNQLKGEEQKKMTREERVEHKKKVDKTRLEIKEFAKDHPDFWNYVDRVDELSLQNPNLDTGQLYVLAGGKLEEKPPGKKQEEKKKEVPDTRPGSEAGMKKSDKNLSRREIIAEEWQKLK